MLSPSTISSKQIGHTSSSSLSLGSEFVLLDDVADEAMLVSVCCDRNRPSVIGCFLPFVSFAILL